MSRLFWTTIILLAHSSVLLAEPNIRHIGTWNMKWLGTAAGSQLDELDNIPLYVEKIGESKATLIALQEIGGSHAVDQTPHCDYLDRIVDKLNEGGGAWTYILDKKNRNQRLAYLYKAELWELSDPETFYPGGSYRSVRRPFAVTVKSLGPNAELKFRMINIHMKAYDDEAARRESQFTELAQYLYDYEEEEDVVICGDTNIYHGEIGTDAAMEAAGYPPVGDNERTSIHEGELSQRFDRFFASQGIEPEISSAREIVGSGFSVDAHTVTSDSDIAHYDANISDHFVVTLAIDVSEEIDVSFEPTDGPFVMTDDFPNWRARNEFPASNTSWPSGGRTFGVTSGTSKYVAIPGDQHAALYLVDTTTGSTWALRNSGSGLHWQGAGAPIQQHRPRPPFPRQ